jgi:hypothetical protein
MLGFSESYAVVIRARRRRPHPRHWQALAKLVGVIATIKEVVGVVFANRERAQS